MEWKPTKETEQVLGTSWASGCEAGWEASEGPGSRQASQQSQRLAQRLCCMDVYLSIRIRHYVLDILGGSGDQT